VTVSRIGATTSGFWVTEMLWINLLGYAASASVLDTKPDVSQQLKTWIAEWRRRARERRELSELGERDRHDLCISRCDAQREAQKPFWRA
jgi:uncharacterized protein YjiS (DUF1127 family)